MNEFKINSEPIEIQTFYLLKIENNEIISYITSKDSMIFYICYVKCKSTRSGREKTKFMICTDFNTSDNDNFIFTNYLNKKYSIQKKWLKKWNETTPLSIIIPFNHEMRTIIFNNPVFDYYYNPEKNLFEILKS